MWHHEYTMTKHKVFKNVIVLNVFMQIQPMQPKDPYKKELWWWNVISQIQSSIVWKPHMMPANHTATIMKTREIWNKHTNCKHYSVYEHNKPIYSCFNSLICKKQSRVDSYKNFIKHIYLFCSGNITISWTGAKQNHSKSYKVAVCCCPPAQSSCHTSACSAVMRFYLILPAFVQSQSS